MQAERERVGARASRAEVRLPGGRVIDAARVDSASGPQITLIVGLACVIFGLSVVWRGEPSETAAGFWPPAGAALVALLLVPVRRWGWVVAGILVPTAVGLALDFMPVRAGLIWGLGNSVEPVVSALVLRRLTTSTRSLTSGRALVEFLLVAVVAGPMIGAAIGTVGSVLDYDQHWFESWLEWAMGDGLGVLVITPLLLGSPASRRPARTSRETSALGVLVAIATALLFADIGTHGAALLPYLMLVALVWAGLRFGVQAVAAAGFVVALGANLATETGFGPFALAETEEGVITLPIFLAVAIVTSFVVASMAGDLADRDEVERLLTHQSTHDDLTGLANRTLFRRRLVAALADPARTTAGVVMVDLDGLAKVNERRGQAAGDAALRVVAEVLCDVAGDSDLVARYGGDKFVTLALGLDDPVAARARGVALMAALTDGIEAAGLQHLLRWNVGVALVGSDDPISADDLVQRAVLAVREARSTDGPALAVFDQVMEDRTRRRVQIAEELRGALDRDELSVVYQPVVELASGRITELEVLARWTNRRFGPVGPDEFITVAEDMGYVGRIGEHVLSEACRALAGWRSDPSLGVPQLRAAVNVSAQQLSDPELPDQIRRALEVSELPPWTLTLEITETAVMQDVDAALRVIGQLRAMRVRLSMDDFGTGHSSLSNLRRVPLDVLKIDRSFVAGLGAVAEDTVIVESIVHLGHSFGLTVVAEGVESPRQLEQLERLGCDHGQGYLWSPGVAEAEVAALLRHGTAIARSRRA